jgi:iron complex outermembrane receptor protein
VKALLFGSSCGSVFVAVLALPSLAVAADPPAKAAPDATTLSDVVVTAHTNQTSMAGGGMIAIQETPVVRTTIGQGFIDKQSPLGNTLATIRLAPGVNVGQDNPLGLSERSEFSVRGLDQSQMGFVVEGLPTGDPGTYTSFGGSWIDNENVKAVTITQGTTDLSSPVIGASGGLVEIRMRDPSDERGGTLSLSGGSFDARRAFLRFETGDIASLGARAMVSYSDTVGDNWRGPGSSERRHLDFKLVKDWNADAKTSLLFQYHYLFDQRETIPTLAQFTTPGLNYNSASAYTFGATSFYKFSPYAMNFFTVAAPTELALTPNVSLTVTPYYRYLYQYAWASSVFSDTSVFDGNLPFTSVNNQPFSQGGKFTAETVNQTANYIGGINTYATVHAGNNTVTVGAWYEHDYVWYYSKFKGVDQFGNVNGGFLKVGNGLDLVGTDYHFNKDILAVYIGDEISLDDDRLKILFGIKDLGVNTSGANLVPGATPSVGVYINRVTPRLGFTYKLGDHGQVFADLVTNVRPPPPDSTYFDTYNVATGTKSFVGNTGQAPEYSFQQEAGYRYQSTINFSAAAFHNVLYNHQVSTIVNQNGFLIGSTLSAGTEEIYGLDVELGARPWHNISPYISAQYLHAQTETNLPVGNDFLPTAGKVGIRAPKFMAAGGLTYDDGALFGSITAKHVSSQFSTFMNDQTMPASNQVDLSLGYRLPDVGFAKRPTIQLNLLNLADKPYLGSVASPTGAAVATVGTKGTLISAGQPIYYTNAGLTALVTIKLDF